MEKEDYQSFESKSSESLIDNHIVKDSFDKSVESLIEEDDEDSLSSEEDNTERRVKNNRYPNNDEKLSEVIEEPEDTIAELKVKPSRNNVDIPDFEKVSILRDRISSLNREVLSLKNEFIKEVDLFRKEREEYQLIQEKNDLIALEEATEAARAAAKAYAAESPLSNELNAIRYSNSCEILDVDPEETLSELTILDYEKKLAKYQDALAFAKAEKRYNIRREFAFNTYRQKLIQVEKLCDEELEKIKENANSLIPLNKIVSQWYREDRCSGDADKMISDNDEKLFTNNYSNGYLKTLQLYDYTKNSPNAGENFQIKLNAANEIFKDKFNVDDISREFSLNDHIITQNGNVLPGNDNGENYFKKSVNPLDSIKWEPSNQAFSPSI